MERIFPIPGGTPVSESVPMFFDLLSKRFITGHPSQSNERLSFKLGRLSIFTVIIDQLTQMDRERTRLSMRAQSQVDMKNPGDARFDEFNYSLDKQVIELTVIH